MWDGKAGEIMLVPLFLKSAGACMTDRDLFQGGPNSITFAPQSELQIPCSPALPTEIGAKMTAASGRQS